MSNTRRLWTSVLGVSVVLALLAASEAFGRPGSRSTGSTAKDILVDLCVYGIVAAAIFAIGLVYALIVVPILKRIRTPLHAAAAKGRCDLVASLLEKGIGANSKGEKGRTPLHEAASAGQTKAIELLLANGANVNAEDDTLATPLHLAAARGDVEAVRLLLASGAEVNKKNSNGSTPLYLAERVSKRDSVAQLIRQHGGTT